ncbi:MAG: DUF2304 domain-containing protein [Lentisphaeria bacterium]|nr:DUF2304 domain-containing protein [Lentisphaeria bacterium]
MSSLSQIVSLVGSVAFLLMIIYTVYAGKLREAYAIIWLFSSLMMIVISVSETLLNFLSRMLGIQTPAFALLICMLMGILLLLFQITIVISEHNQKINRLLQEVALLRADHREGDR